MDLQEIWNEICFIVNRYKNTSEREFQIEVENVFEKIGWSRFRGEIISQQVIPIGSAQSLKPDIIISYNGERKYVVELKKPDADLKDKNAGQLKSYMKQLQLDYGLLIGNTIQMYYNYNRDQIMVSEVSFIDKNADGVELIGLLSKSGYSDTDMKAYCEKNIEAKSHEKDVDEIVGYVTSQEGVEIAVSLLKTKLQEKYSVDVTVEAIDKVILRIERRNVPHPPSPTGGRKTYPSNDLTPADAKLLCRKNELNLTDNITFASKNKTADNYWANPNVNCLKHEWWLLLNDYVNRKLHIFNIPANSIHLNQVKKRSDASKIDLRIEYENKSYEDIPSGIQFIKWFIKTLPY